MNFLYSDRFFNEIVVDIKQTIEEINSKLLDAGIIGGYDLEKVSSDLKGHMLIAVTEQRTKSEIDKLAKELRDHYARSEEHTSELQSRFDHVCRLLRERKNQIL